MPRWLSKITSSINATNDVDIINLNSLQKQGVFLSNVPDYSKMENINRLTGSGGTWTADRDGFVLLSAISRGQQVLFYINNTIVQDSWDSGGHGIHNQILEIKKGDVLRHSGYYESTHFAWIYIPPVRSVAAKYSTEETNTGQIWINDKAIYRRVITGTTASSINQWTTIGTIEDIDELISIHGAINRGPESIVPINAILTGQLSHGVECWLGPDGVLLMHHRHEDRNNKPFTVIVEYTKM
jgi:hypothetical protein